MDLFSIFKSGKYFDKHIEPKCDYCRFGKRAKDGNKVLCEKRGLVDANYSCSKFIYSPLKRIPVKQLNFVGSLADEELYIESAGDRAEKEEELKKIEAAEKKSTGKKSDDKKAEEKKAEETPKEDKAKETPAEEAEAKQAEEAPKSEKEETPAEKAEEKQADEAPKADAPNAE
ncbi:hypothetical protein SAMN02910353_01033 [Ruminococcus sp. YRD2003]|uniref:hypothetical protein n=1 Tax=Ruminococcus sp. YRD2003 TaxID=1452313 RepID=UPI0008B82CED|nr:hypothetical protein SAMN02910353_01033 [Ruminococcus flavefaciens]